MVSSNNEAQGQSQGHVTFTFMWYFLKKKPNKNITWQHRVCLILNITEYITVYKVNVYIVNYIYKQIHIEIFFGKFCTAIHV